MKSCFCGETMNMRYGMISCITLVLAALLLGACSAEVDEPSSVPQKDGLIGAISVVPVATATTKPDVAPPARPGAIACFVSECTSNEECVSLCHDSSSKCTDRHCYVP